jgi:NADP-dependent 3-hydroxy acid dehydrogenase YdfG
LVTGASAGIGQATVRALVERGMQVIATGRRSVQPQGLPSGDSVRYIAGDLLDASFRKELVDVAQDVDVLVNAAGFLKHAPFLESEIADWRAVFETNVVSVLAITQGVTRNMAKRGHGQIVMLTSTFAYDAAPRYSFAYAASKRALRAIAEGLRAELAGNNIRICEIAPGYTETEIRRHIDHPDVIKAHALKKLPALTPRDVGEAIALAVSCPVLETIVVRPAAVG